MGTITGRRATTLTAALVSAGLMLTGCGDDDDPGGTLTSPRPATSSASPTVSATPSAPELDAGDVASAAQKAVDLLGDRAPVVTWTLLASGDSAADVTTAIEDGSIVNVPGAVGPFAFGVPVRRSGAVYRVLASGSEGDLIEGSEEFDAWYDSLDEDFEADNAQIVFAQLILFGQGYTEAQIAQAVEDGTLVAAEGDRFSCLWEEYLSRPGSDPDGGIDFPGGVGLTIEGVEPANASEFGDDPCGTGDTDPETDTEPEPVDEPEPAPGDIQVMPPSDGQQPAFDCEGLSTPEGVELEVLPASDPGLNDEGFGFGPRCNFTVRNADGIEIAGMAINLEYYCPNEATRRVTRSGASPVKGKTNVFREVEYADPEGPLFGSFSGEFDSQEKLFALLGPYATTTIVFSVDEGDITSVDFLDTATELAARLHPPVEPLDC